LTDGSRMNDRLNAIIDILKKEYPDVKCFLDFTNPLELLIATILSAQCTDERVNKVTKSLFKKYRSVEDYAEVELKELEEDIKTTGFYKNKAKNIKECCSILASKYNGNIPTNIDILVKLPGVGRKTANMVLGNAFNIPGIIVDTHVKRLSVRLGLSEENDPDKIELDLMKIVPKEEWTRFSLLLMAHGRNVCFAKNPLHGECKINELCPSRYI